MSDYVPNLDEVISLHVRCGRRVFFVEGSGAYCEKCGARGIPVDQLVRYDRRAK